ncbi:hypothetical protein XA68_17553 [Ophiocordyceps unilateralis]|uniref:mRNA N(6)-methyladenine demethylase n=1 Tax=Ophiocordyceps unilateralis TaxID=268505 RepID=A0A2A9PIQ6_OPHUN|nr:hypothetical protein XA68_17553 [Ophiocordyceps unilateralis]
MPPNSSSLTDLDAHQQPPASLRAAWKRLTRLDPDACPVDDHRLPSHESGFARVGAVDRERLARAFSRLRPDCVDCARVDVPVLSHPLLPGLLVVPSLVPPPIQTILLDRMLHRDLADRRHRTNLHLHYDLPYPESDNNDDDDASRSLFSLPPDAPALFCPKDPAVHKPLSARQVLQRRLHWLTLGGQYDWTKRVYPSEAPPAFPSDLARFLEALFPDTLAQAAIVNLYSPGDTMMVHRDVSEDVDRGLVSLSLGCDALFLVAPDDPDVLEPPNFENKRYLLLRLRSGDAIYMTNEARRAWHGVPKVIKDTCPSHLEAWPARQDDLFREWEGWMRNKRVNLNVRQINE